MINDIVEIRFLDHSEDGEEVLEFVVWGRVHKETENAYIIRSWDYVSRLDEAEHGGQEHNCKTFAIVKKAILCLKTLKLGDASQNLENEEDPRLPP